MLKEHVRELIDHGYELIELKSGTKLPLLGWRTREPLGADAAARLDRVGVRMTATQIVVDIDRHEGRPRGSRDALRAVSTDVDLAPTVWTPHGTHLYFTLPDGCGKLRHTLPEFPGTEFKTLGRFVVAPGCAGYDWDFTGPTLPAPALPDPMLRMILKPVLAAGNSGMDAEWGPGELAAALDQMDSADFRSHDAWLALMCACHEVTAGLGMNEFISWSTRDAPYAGHGPVISGRWNSLHAGRSGNAGSGTLLKILSDHGADAPVDVRTRDAVADFDGVVDHGTRAPTGANKKKVERPLSLMEKMCKWFRAVDEDGRLKVYARRHDEVLKRHYWVRYARRDFLEVTKSVMHMPMVECGEKTNGDPKYEDAGLHWLDHHAKKTTYRGITFAPEHEGDRTPGGKLNLWQGFAVRENPSGSWAMLKELMFESLCAWDLASYEYCMNWLARAVQRPWEPGGTALVFRGKKGSGKGTLGRAFMRLFGQHGMQVTSPALLTGRFNAHLRDVCALFADEAFWAGDKTGEGILKGIITEPAIAYEGKGQNVEMGRNCVHMIMASNEDWVVPAGMDSERRFAVFGVEEGMQSREYWNALNLELDSGGLAAMLWELRRRDVDLFDPFKVPGTLALAEQKLRTMDVVAAWLYEEAGDDWRGFGEQHDAGYLCEEVHSSYLRHCKSREVRGTRSTATMLGMAIKKFLPEVRKHKRFLQDRRQYFYQMPEPENAIEKIEKMLGI